MNVLLRRASLRYLRLHWAQSALALLGVAVGVAAWVSVQGAAKAAEDAFAVSTRQAFGAATHQLLPLDRSFDEAVYATLRRELPAQPAAPVLLERVLLRAAADPDATQRSVQLVGIDPLAEAELRGDGVAAAGVGPGLAGMIGDVRAAVLPASLAQSLGLTPGATFEVVHAGRTHALQLFEVAEDDTLPLGADTLLVDIAAAQRVLAMPGRLSRVDLLLDHALSADLLERLGPEVELVSTLARSQAVSDMTRAYRLNLLALSLLTLLVGLLLVYSTMTHLVSQRAGLFARLQALGMSAGELRRLVLGEALLLGVIGGALGVVVGTLLAGWLVGVMAGNITDLYFRVQVQTLAPQPGVMLAGLGLGVIAALAGGFVPATRALAGGVRRAAALRVELGVSALLAVAATVVFRVSESLAVGFFGLFLAAVAGALLVPGAIELLARGLAWLPGLRGRLLARMTLREAVAGLARTRIALAGLVLAIATLVALDLMVANFRSSVETWLQGTVTGDLVVGLDSTVHPDPREAPLRDIAEQVAQLDGVDAVAGMRFLRLRDGADTLLLRAIDPAHALPALTTGSAGEAFARGDGLLVSEPLTLRRGLVPGDRLRLAFAGGSVELPVLGVYRDYLSDRGVALMSLEGLARWSGDESLSSFSVLGDDAAELRPRIEALLAEVPGVELSDAAELRARTMEIFDRTFAVTHVLKLLVAGTAMMGMLGALLAWLLDRRELRRSLRALGLSWREAYRQVLLETGVLGVAAAAVAVPLGTVLSALLVFVINLRAFGWSMQFELLAAPLWQGALLAVVTALLAGALALVAFARADGRQARDGTASARRVAAALFWLAVALPMSLLLAGCTDPQRAAPDVGTGSLDAAGLLAGDAGDERFATVTAPREFDFPRDHGEHPEYRTEWWYLTANLHDASGRRFGLQYTLFRFAMAPDDSEADEADDTGHAQGWRSRQVYMAHLAITHVQAGDPPQAERLAPPG
ncbi:MAG: FtsX-like permease family protein, partial [Gammaproteobacteria bacterium]|nr:FtsX-like permease family protein [Gammaproteobacteria bacterium]